MSDESGQQHPLSVYFKIWVLLFVLSALSYLVDFFQLQGYLRWTLVLIFMTLKAGFIMAIFMHLQWERSALRYLLLAPPLVLLVLIFFMAFEGMYTENSRIENFSASEVEFVTPHGSPGTIRELLNN